MYAYETVNGGHFPKTSSRHHYLLRRGGLEVYARYGKKQEQEKKGKGDKESKQTT